jgi:hypothetical protein
MMGKWLELAAPLEAAGTGHDEDFGHYEPVTGDRCRYTVRLIAVELE